MINPILGENTYTEIMSQGDTWKSILLKAQAQLECVLTWLQQPYGEVIFTGCGSTHYLSISAAKHWIELTKKSAQGVPSSEIWYYPSSTFSASQPLLVAVSRSGETTETIQAIRVYKKLFGKACLAICCYPESSMIKEVSYALLAEDAQEISIAQTRSFSSMFILTQLLAGYAAGNTAYIRELHRIPEQFNKIIEKYDSLVKMVANNRYIHHFVFLGSGLYYGLASEIMLKLKEMSVSISEVYHFMEFRHGPMSMITDQSLVIGLMSDDRKKEENRVLQDMKKLGAKTLAITENRIGVEADYIIELETGLSEQARGALFLPTMQLMSYYHAVAKGLNPDQPKNLQAVVHL